MPKKTYRVELAHIPGAMQVINKRVLECKEGIVPCSQGIGSVMLVPVCLPFSKMSRCKHTLVYL